MERSEKSNINSGTVRKTILGMCKELQKGDLVWSIV